jgi:hypothetical protein
MTTVAAAMSTPSNVRIPTRELTGRSTAQR